MLVLFYPLERIRSVSNDHWMTEITECLGASRSIMMYYEEMQKAYN